MTDGWERQSGGLWLKVSPYRVGDPEQGQEAENVMRGVIENIANSHGASFGVQNFRKNSEAIGSDDLCVDLYLAKWELCDPKPICLGAAYGWDTYGFTLEGALARSFYTEDVSVLKSQLRPLIKARPNGKTFPDESIAECLERISLDRMRREGMAFRFGEVDPDNTTMMRQLNGNNAHMGTTHGNAILEFKQIPTNLTASWLTPVNTEPVRRGTTISKRHFLTSWRQDLHDIRLLVTKGHATAAGRPRLDIRTWHNGHLPERPIFQSVIASALTAIKREADDNRWADTAPLTVVRTPRIPLGESKRQKFKALYDAAETDIGLCRRQRHQTFSNPVPEAHVFVVEDERMVRAVVEAGASPRLFGEKPMIPGVNILRNSAYLPK